MQWVPPSILPLIYTVHFYPQQLFRSSRYWSHCTLHGLRIHVSVRTMMRWRELPRVASLPIAVGERVFTRWAFRELLERGTAKILNPDPSHVGGIFETRFIAAMAEMHDAGVAPHCPLGAIALAACLPLDAIVPNFVFQEHVTLGQGYLKELFIPVDGYLPIPDRPGLGVELDNDAIFRPQAPLHPEDGTVVDW